MTRRAPSLAVVVVGCGRLGTVLAEQLGAQGHRVTVIDPRPDALDRIAPEFSGFRVVGNATELAVLERADVRRADLVLVTTSDDNANLMIAQVAARVLGVRAVVARVVDPAREALYDGLGIETVCPGTLAALAFIDRIAAVRRAEDA